MNRNEVIAFNERLNLYLKECYDSISAGNYTLAACLNILEDKIKLPLPPKTKLSDLSAGDKFELAVNTNSKIVFTFLDPEHSRVKYPYYDSKNVLFGSDNDLPIKNVH